MVGLRDVGPAWKCDLIALTPVIGLIHLLVLVMIAPSLAPAIFLCHVMLVRLSRYIVVARLPRLIVLILPISLRQLLLELGIAIGLGTKTRRPDWMTRMRSSEELTLKLFGWEAY